MTPHSAEDASTTREVLPSNTNQTTILSVMQRFGTVEEVDHLGQQKFQYFDQSGEMPILMKLLLSLRFVDEPTAEGPPS